MVWNSQDSRSKIHYIFKQSDITILRSIQLSVKRDIPQASIFGYALFLSFINYDYYVVITLYYHV